MPLIKNFLLACFFFASSLLLADMPVIDIKAIEKAGIFFDGIVELPTKNMRALKKGNRIAFVSENGRYVIKGELIDVWQKKKLTTIEDIKDSVSRLHFGKMVYDLKDLNSFTFGQGNKAITLFTDPLCKSCKGLLKALYQLGEDYEVTVVIHPLLGKESAAISNRLACLEKSEKERRFKQSDFKDLLSKPLCTKDTFKKTSILTSILDVHTVPLLVAPDGRFRYGIIDDVASFIQGEG